MLHRHFKENGLGCKEARLWGHQIVGKEFSEPLLLGGCLEWGWWEYEIGEMVIISGTCHQQTWKLSSWCAQWGKTVVERR